MRQSRANFGVLFGQGCYGVLTQILDLFFKRLVVRLICGNSWRVFVNLENLRLQILALLFSGKIAFLQVEGIVRFRTLFFLRLGCGLTFVGRFLCCFSFLVFLLLATFNVATSGCQRTAKHRTTHQTLPVLITGFFVGQVEASLHALKELLRSFGDTFCTHGFTGGGSVVFGHLRGALLGDLHGSFL